MITFNTQEEFENAVMDVLKKRLMLIMSKDYQDGSVIATNLTDAKDHEVITSDYVYVD